MNDPLWKAAEPITDFRQATELRRDLPQSLHDSFGILIDSTRGRSNAHVFQINPQGTQVDGLISEERRALRGRPGLIRRD